MRPNAYSFVNSRGVTWYLHGKHVTLKNGRQQLIFFFARDIRDQFSMSELPTGYVVVETERTGMPVLKKA